MELSFQSFFVLLSSQAINLNETPDIVDRIMRSNYEQMQDIIFKQLFLSDCGVSFDYTDTLDMFELDDLVEFCKKWNEFKRNSSKAQ